MNDFVLYEFPLNERIRVFMRLEQLFQQTDHFMQGAAVWDSRAAISSLLEILTIFSRNDLKSEILKELDRHANVLNKMANHQRIDPAKLQAILDKLSRISDELYSTPGKIGHTLMESDLCKSISQRNSIPGGTCAFDLPSYHFWLQQSPEQRKNDLARWLQPFEIIREAIDILLKFIRQSAPPATETAELGFFQKTLDHSLPYQLLRVAIPGNSSYFAEISGGKHRFTIRFMQPNEHDRPTQTQENVTFQLTSCIL